VLPNDAAFDNLDPIVRCLQIAHARGVGVEAHQDVSETTLGRALLFILSLADEAECAGDNSAQPSREAGDHA